MVELVLLNTCRTGLLNDLLMSYLPRCMEQCLYKAGPFTTKRPTYLQSASRPCQNSSYWNGTLLNCASVALGNAGQTETQPSIPQAAEELPSGKTGDTKHISHILVRSWQADNQITNAKVPQISRPQSLQTVLLCCPELQPKRQDYNATRQQWKEPEPINCCG